MFYLQELNAGLALKVVEPELVVLPLGANDPNPWVCAPNGGVAEIESIILFKLGNKTEM